MNEVFELIRLGSGKPIVEERMRGVKGGIEGVVKGMEV